MPKLYGMIGISGIVPFLMLSSILMLLIVCIFYKLIYSPFGRVLKGVRDDEIAVLSLGRNVTAIKIRAFVISGAFIGIAGIIYARYVSYIDPTSFNPDEAIFILAVVLIVGPVNTRGLVVGAIFVVVFPEPLRFVGLPDSGAAN